MMGLLVALGIAQQAKVARADSPSNAAAVEADPDWEALKLPWELVEGLTEPARCLSTERLFLACIATFRAVVRVHLGPAGDVWPSHWSQWGPQRAPAKFKTVGRVSYGRLRRSPQALSPTSRYARARSQLLGWRGEFGRATKTTLKADLQRIRDEFGTKVSRSGAVSTVVAAASQAFLRTYQDPFARLVPDATDRAQLASLGVPHVGIGLKLLRVGRAHIIERVEAGSPAATRDLARGTLLMAIDGWSTANFSGPELDALVAGPAGSKVTLTVRRRGQTRRVVVTRKDYVVPHVRHAVFRADGAPVGWLSIGSFHSNRVCEGVQRALATFNDRRVGAVVLDLRGNRGGVIVQAMCVASHLAPPDLLLAKLTSDRTEAEFHTEYRTDAVKGARFDGPLVILVDGKTQSAAEILAAGLREVGRARIAGQRTYGKGSVQAAHRWAPGVAATLFRQAARYLVGGGRDIHLLGLTPDSFIDVTGAPRQEPSVHADIRYLEAFVQPPAADAARASPQQRIAACAPTSAQGVWRTDDAMGQHISDPTLWSALDLASRCSATSKPAEGTKTP